MPKPKLYDKRETLRLTIEMDQAVEDWRQEFGLRRGEAIRILIGAGLEAPWRRKQASGAIKTAKENGRKHE